MDFRSSLPTRQGTHLFLKETTGFRRSLSVTWVTLSQYCILNLIYVITLMDSVYSLGRFHRIRTVPVEEICNRPLEEITQTDYVYLEPPMLAGAVNMINLRTNVKITSDAM